MWYRAWILVAFVVGIPSMASPFSRHFMTMEIDCSDFRIVQNLQRNRVQFKCFEGTEPFLSAITEQRVSNELQKEVELLNEAIINSIDNCKGLKKCRKILCSTNYVYNPSLDQCVPMNYFSSSQTPEDSFYDGNYKTYFADRCKEGYIYHYGLTKCLPQNHYYFKSTTSDAIISGNIPKYTFNRCGQDSVFVSEIGLCVPNPTVERERPQMDVPISASLISDSRQRCPQGHLYSPEVNLCLPFVKQPQHHKIPFSFSLVKDQPQVSKDWAIDSVGAKKCKKNEFYLSELDICIAEPQPVMQNDAPAVVVTTKDPFRPTLAPLTSDQVGRSKCKKGQVYISEIDFCVENPNSRN